MSKTAKKYLQLLKESYRLDERAEKFIEQHPSLLPYLLEAPKIIKEIFPGSSLILEHFVDFESDDEELFIIIKTSLKAKEAVQKENELFLKWYVKLPPHVLSLLNYTTESE